MTSDKYTVICEFRGGTYVSQVQGRDINDAVRSWIELLRVERPMGRSSAYLARSLLADLDDNPPKVLKGLQGVWCVSGVYDGDLALANVVASA